MLTGDTVGILPVGEAYDSETKIKKVSLASVRSPRVGNERIAKPDEPYAAECKDRLRVICTGKSVTVTIHYEKDIPMGEVCNIGANLEEMKCRARFSRNFLLM